MKTLDDFRKLIQTTKMSHIYKPVMLHWLPFSLLLAANGESLKDDELLTFTEYTGRTKASEKRVDELWACVGRRGGKSRAMAIMAAYFAGLCDHSDKLARGERGVVIAQDKRAANRRSLRLHSDAVAAHQGAPARGVRSQQRHHA
jgi:hypothetical protein